MDYKVDVLKYMVENMDPDVRAEMESKYAAHLFKAKIPRPYHPDKDNSRSPYCILDGREEGYQHQESYFPPGHSLFGSNCF
jgi:hypothetical protein